MKINMKNSRREMAGWIGFWQVVCQAVLDDAATEEQLDWIDRRIVDLPTLQMWLTFREDFLKEDPSGDPDEVREVLKLPVKRGETWERVVQNGFRRTASEANGAHRKSVMRELAAVLYSPSLLSELEATIYCNESLPDTWRKIEAGAE